MVQLHFSLDGRLFTKKQLVTFLARRVESMLEADIQAQKKASASTMSRLINSVASVQRQRLALWPAHTVISSGISRTEAGAATVWMNACCKGNGSAGSLTSASSSIKRFLIPLASLPVKASVRPVFFAAGDERADR